MTEQAASATAVLAWAARILALPKAAPPHELLEIYEHASGADAQSAFHRVARRAHPDLHRGLSSEDLERVTSAYARVAGAYQVFRQATPPGRGAGPVPATPSGAAPAATAAQQMSPRALVYYRKAELALRQGNLAGAVLQIKMAIGADPSSTFLRTALVEVERELRKTP